MQECDASIRVSDGGWLHGAGLFETMRAENGRVFRLARHLARLRASAEKLLTPISLDDLPTDEILQELMKRNELTSARIRLSVTSGPMLDNPDANASQLTVCATATKLSPPDSRVYANGVTVKLCDYRISTSDPLAGHKTTCYLPRLLGLRLAQQASCMEAIWFTTQKHLAEGCISNIFIISGETLKTPPLSTPVLPGVARSTVLELAGAAGLAPEETVLGIDDLLDADEVFLTNSIMQVLPVISIEKHTVRDGQVGPFSKKLLQEYRELLKTECA